MLTIESENFQPLADYVFVSAEPNKNSIKKFANGLKIVIDTRFNPHDRGNVTQDGIVRFVQIKLTNRKPIEIQKGDKIYFHHFWGDEDNKVNVNNEFLYHGLYESCYCKIVDGKIIMLGDYNLLEPINHEEKVYSELSEHGRLLIKLLPEKKILNLAGTPTIYDLLKKNSTNKAIVRHANKRLAELGVNVGDTIFFQKNADYDIDVEGKKYYCMNNKY